MSHDQQVCHKGYKCDIDYNNNHVLVAIMEGLFPNQDHRKGFKISKSEIDLIINTAVSLLKMENGEKWCPTEDVEYTKNYGDNNFLLLIIEDFSELLSESSAEVYHYRNV